MGHVASTYHSSTTYACDGHPGGSVCDATFTASGSDAWCDGWTETFVRPGKGDHPIRWDKEPRMGTNYVWYGDFMRTILCPVCSELFADFMPIREETKRKWFRRA